MIKGCYTAFVIFCIALSSYSQVPDEEYYNRLYFTCKVWGYVKYHHTRISGGYVDWDDVLLASVKGIKTAPDRKSFNDSLMVMLNKAGKMDSYFASMPNVPDSLNNNRDLSWMNDPVISGEVSSYLGNIREVFRPMANKYVGRAAAGNPSFDNDNKYFQDQGFSDEGKRILALFRYWNIIHYFYPYKNLMDQDWDISLKEFIPRIAGAQDIISYTLAFKELTTRLCDTHTFFTSSAWSSWDGTAYTPFIVRFIENEMVITRVLPSVTGIREGDIIKKIDGIEIHKLRDSLRKYSHGSNNPAIERNLNDIVLWGPPGEFTVTTNDGSGDKALTLERSYNNFLQLNVPDNARAWQQQTSAGNCSFGIVDMGRLKKDDVETMFKELWETDAIIFDIRNYPQGTLWTIVDYLFYSPIHIASFTVPDATYPGRLYWQEAEIGTGKKNIYDGTVIILFDERTLSQAEYTCMGLEQFPGAVKIGSTTAAADGNVSRIYLPGGISTMATFLGTFYPDYKATQRIGIIPDIEIRPTILGIREHRDELMELALRCRIENEIAKLYPNPTDGLLYFDEPEDGTPLKYEIYDLAGRKQLNGSSASGEIDITCLASGMYIVKVIKNRHVLTKKIIRN